MSVKGTVPTSNIVVIVDVAVVVEGANTEGGLCRKGVRPEEKSWDRFRLTGGSTFGCCTWGSALHRKEVTAVKLTCWTVLGADDGASLLFEIRVS